jgi:hypothetical protein
MSAVSQRKWSVQALGIALAVLNVLLWYGVPTLRAAADAVLDPQHAPDNPLIVNGVQELFVYFDPWLARGVFPVVYTVGLAAIPFLMTAPGQPDASSRGSTVATALLVIGFEIVWLFLIAVGVLLRGPNWNLYWPGEPRTPKVEPLNFVNLSDYFWLGWLNQPDPAMPWAQRELPGLVLLGAYFLAGLVVAALVSWGRNSSARWLLLVVIVQVAALVPLKMLLRWLFTSNM